MRYPLVRIWITVLAFAALIIPTLGSGDSMANFDRLGHQMMCICGCGQILLECNHVGCPSSDGMRAELRTAVDSGLADKKVYAQFINKYGPTVMAAPVFQGFNILAWIMPGAVLLLGSLGAALLIYSWKNKSRRLERNPPKPEGLETVAELSANGTALRDRIRRETEL